MAEMTENGWNWLEMAGNSRNGWKWFNLAGNGLNGWTWLTMARNYYKFLEMPGKCMEAAGNG